MAGTIADLTEVLKEKILAGGQEETGEIGKEAQITINIAKDMVIDQDQGDQILDLEIQTG